MNISFKGFWDESLDQQLLTQQLTFFKSEIQAKDNEIFKSDWRKNKGYVPHSILPRTIITKYGHIRYQRRLYKYWDNDINRWKYVFLVDKEFDVSKKQRIHGSFKKEIIKKIGTGKRYQDILDEFKNSNISKVSIHKIFKNADIKKNLIEKIKLNDGQKLYMNIDDCFVGNYKIRPISFSTGIENGKLKDKRISFELKNVNELNKSYYLNRKKLVSWIYQELDNYYDNWQNADLIVAGDGASWIKTIARNLKAKQILSRFHFITYSRNSFLIINNNNYKYIDYQSYQDFWKAINNFNLKRALLVLENYKNKLENTKIFPGKLRKTKVFIQYIKNNWEAFKNYSQSWNIGCSAESVVFHLVKQVTRTKNFNFNILNNMLIARTNLINC
ncbi:MAG: Mbov_0401 family ICE element transposase-like protein [Spiroplasma sp.]